MTPTTNALTTLTPQEAAELIKNGKTIGFSGFTPAGAPKAIPEAIAARAKDLHAAGKDFKVGVLTGASTNKWLNGALAEAEAISFRRPYQSDPTLRAASTRARSASSICTCRSCRRWCGTGTWDRSIGRSWRRLT